VSNRIRVAAALTGAAGLLAVASCGTPAASSPPTQAVAPSTMPTAAEVRSYVAAVERVRLPVNTLLNGADPILDAWHDKRITGATASARMSALEHRFASYTVKMQLVDPSNPQLKVINRPYASTYFYEDSYLATLASDLTDGDVDNLPDTQAAQRLAIVIWRTKLEVIARRAGVTLPADIQQAGRGEIAPSPDGS
jgi:hypothetical protein